MESMIFLTQHDGAIVGPIAKLLGYIINWIYIAFSAIGIENAAICIVLFTIIVRALMIPLNLKQSKATKLSSRMNPEIAKVQEKYKGKKDEASQRKMAAETQAIYDKYGANPLSGCLPLLITFPIMIALYRVIYNIPAYIPAIKEMYEVAASAIQGVDGYVDTLTGLLNTGKNMNGAVSLVVENGAATVNSIIDVLATFSPEKWEELAAAFPTIASTLNTQAEMIGRVNNVFGIFSITEVPQILSITVLVPILAAGLQWYQGMQMSKGQPKADPNNQAANMTKSMNTFMPIMSGVFCLMLPIGVGLYWITGSVFAIAQQFFVNRYFDKVDLDELIKQNQMKALKKKQRRGEDVSQAMRDLAKAPTKSIQVEEKEETPAPKKEFKASDYKKSDVSYSSKSIAANANILKNRDMKGDK